MKMSMNTDVGDTVVMLEKTSNTGWGRLFGTAYPSACFGKAASSELEYLAAQVNAQGSREMGVSTISFAVYLDSVSILSPGGEVGNLARDM